MKSVFLFLGLLSIMLFAQNEQSLIQTENPDHDSTVIDSNESKNSESKPSLEDENQDKYYKTFAIAEYDRKLKKHKDLKELIYSELIRNLKDIASIEVCPIINIEKRFVNTIIPLRISEDEEVRVYLPDSSKYCIGKFCPDVILFLRKLVFTEWGHKRDQKSANNKKNNIKPYVYYVYWDNKTKSTIKFGKIVGEEVPQSIKGLKNLSGIEKVIKSFAEEIAVKVPLKKPE